VDRRGGQPVPVSELVDLAVAGPAGGTAAISAPRLRADATVSTVR